MSTQETNTPETNTPETSPTTSLKEELSNTIKNAMRNKEKDKLTTLRMFSAAIKQIEVDQRRELDDAEVLNVVTTMIKQRNESIRQFDEAGREELSAKEHQEIAILQKFLPPALTDNELETIIDETISQLNASGMKDMGKVMAKIKPKIQGRSNPAVASALVKARLTA